MILSIGITDNNDGDDDAAGRNGAGRRGRRAGIGFRRIDGRRRGSAALLCAIPKLLLVIVKLSWEGEVIALLSVVAKEANSEIKTDMAHRSMIIMKT